MKFEKLQPEGLILFEIKFFEDARGFFVERFKSDVLKQAGVECDFIQDNHSRSKPNVVRGLHYQFDPFQGKLVGVIRGRIWDVAVDLRKNSPTFGQHYAVEINDSNGLLLWIPAGFAHGFCVLGEEDADVLYKVDSRYNAKGEGGIRWDDSTLNIQWPLTNPIVSDKDKVLPSLKDFSSKPNPFLVGT